MVQVNLDRRVANDEVSADDVASDSGLHEKTIRVPDDRVLLYKVVVSASATLKQTDAKVETCRPNIAISC